MVRQRRTSLVLGGESLELMRFILALSCTPLYVVCDARSMTSARALGPAGIETEVSLTWLFSRRGLCVVLRSPWVHGIRSIHDDNETMVQQNEPMVRQMSPWPCKGVDHGTVDPVR